MVKLNRHQTDRECPPADEAPADISNSGMTLLSFVERIERLEEEQDGLAADKREVYAELKGTGFDAKIVRKLISLRSMDKADRQEMESLLELYDEAIRKAEKQQVLKSTVDGA